MKIKPYFRKKKTMTTKIFRIYKHKWDAPDFNRVWRGRGFLYEEVLNITMW